MSALPNFIIVGAAKCGTTSLFEYLSAHPDVFTPSNKEPTYFAREVPAGLSEWEDYQKLFAGVEEQKRVGEASVAYLYSPSAPDLMLEKLGPDLKIIVMLRNPVDMMYSLWGHMRRVGSETLEFHDALDAEEARMADEHFAHHAMSWEKNFAYRDRARYAHQLERYFRVFGRENVHVIVYEEFFSDPKSGFRAVCEFLGLHQDHEPVFARHNPAGTVRSAALRDLMRRPSLAKETFKRMVPLRVRSMLRERLESLNRVDQRLPELQPAERSRLLAQFDDEIVELEGMLGRSLQLWKTTPSAATRTA